MYEKMAYFFENVYTFVGEQAQDTGTRLKARFRQEEDRILRCLNEMTIGQIIMSSLRRLIVILLVGYFILTVISYVGASARISAVESEAAYRGEWSRDLIEDGNEAHEAKEQMVENNEIARWCYYSGFSLMGRILRMGVIVSAVLVLASRVWLLYLTAGYLAVKICQRK